MRALLFTLLALGAGAVRAEVFAIGHDEGKVALIASDVATQATTTASAPGCCFIQSGTLTADPRVDRAWFVLESGPAQTLMRFVYSGAGGTLAETLSGGYRVTHLEFDPSRARLLALGLDDATGDAQLAAVDPLSGAITVLGSAGADCCVLRAGVSALDATRTEVLAVGRRDGDTQDHLLRFSTTTGVLAGAHALDPGIAVGDLVVHPTSGVVYALIHTIADDSSRLARIDLAPTFALTPIGAPTLACCFVLAGSAAIDRARNAYLALTREEASSDYVVRSFDLATGVATIGPALPANGLVEDFGVVLDPLFSDGYE